MASLNYLKNTKVYVRILVLIAFCIFAVALLIGMNTISYRITVLDEEYSYTKYSLTNNLDEIIENESIELGEFDVVQFSGFDENKSATINILRAFEVTVSADATDIEVQIAHGTVEDALSRANVTLGEEDLINTELGTELVEDMQITINRVTYEEVPSTEVIPFETITTETPLIKHGRVTVDVSGQDGERTIVTKNKLIDGVIVESEIISETITKEPVTEKLIEGNMYVHASTLDWGVELDANGNPVNYISKHTGKATAYSNFGRPTKLVQGSVAMNLSQFPKGTKLYVKTPDGSFIYGSAVVGDTGTAVNDGSVLIDLFFVSYDDSCRFGAKTMDVYVLP